MVTFVQKLRDNFCSVPLSQVLSIPDNDNISAQIATAMGADLLILMSDVDGIYSGHPSEPGSRLLRTYHPNGSTGIKFWGKSRVGKGGMESKVRGLWLHWYCMSL